MPTATLEQLAKVKGILAQLDQAPPAKMAENRRVAPRVNVRIALDVTLLSSATPAPIQIFTRNLSVSGMAFVSRRMFKAEERIAIRLIIKNAAAKLCLARVTFGRYLTGGMYEMGAEFLECVKDAGHTPIPSHWRLHTLSPIDQAPAPVISIDKPPPEKAPANGKPKEEKPDAKAPAKKS